MKNHAKKPFYEQVAEQIIDQLRDGTAPWIIPWEPGNLSIPHNPVSGTRYKGVNMLWLSSKGIAKGYADPRWLTYSRPD